MKRWSIPATLALLVMILAFTGCTQKPAVLPVETPDSMPLGDFSADEHDSSAVLTAEPVRLAPFSALPSVAS